MCMCVLLYLKHTTVYNRTYNKSIIIIYNNAKPFKLNIDRKQMVYTCHLDTNYKYINKLNRKSATIMKNPEHLIKKMTFE